MLLRARLVYPVGSPPIENGAVWVGEGRFQKVGRFEDLRVAASEPVVDLGEAILLPGLVNAHCHLDYTQLARHIPPPSSFTDWIKQLISLKAGWSYTEFAGSWLSGMHQLIDYGTTLVGDIAAVPELLPDVLAMTPIRITSFLEMITVRSRRDAQELVNAAVQDLSHVEGSRQRAGLSPHAPYSTTQELIRATAATSRAKGWRWSMHLAESAEEQAMFCDRSGPMFQWLKLQRDMSDCGHQTPFAWLEATGALGPDLLLAHGNLIGRDEITRLARTGAHLVHCPRSHDYFGHPPFPYDALEAEGVNVCLGTDSLVSVRCSKGLLPTLSLFAEMSAFAGAHPQVPPERIVEHATRDGASALGWDDAGRVADGLSADLTAIAWSGRLHQAPDAIVHHEGPVMATMVEGRWVKPPPG